MNDYRQQIELRDGRKVTLRSPHETDAPKILEWFSEIVAEDTFISVPPSREITLENEEMFLEKILQRVEDGDALHLYAEEPDGRIVGHMGTDRRPGRMAHCADLGTAVAREWRDCGLGTALMRAYLSEIHRLAVRGLYLGVLANNPRAIHLYENFGCRAWGRCPERIEYKGEFVDLIEMWLPVRDIRL